MGLLWLKIGALVAVREVCSARYLTAYILATGVLGALLALLARSLWAAVGPRSMAALRGERPAARETRLVWGASAFPQVIALLVLLPLDLVIVGRDSFTTTELVDPVSTAWAAFSIALGLSALVWTLFLLFRGVESVSGLAGLRAAAAAATAPLSLAILIGAFTAVAPLLPQGAGCPT